MAKPSSKSTVLLTSGTGSPPSSLRAVMRTRSSGAPPSSWGKEEVGHSTLRDVGPMSNTTTSVGGPGTMATEEEKERSIGKCDSPEGSPGIPNGTADHFRSCVCKQMVTGQVTTNHWFLPTTMGTIRLLWH